MLSKKEIKDIQSLGLKKQRAETGLFVAEGPKIVSELLAVVPGQVQLLLAVKEWADIHRGLVQDLPLHVVSSDELQRASGLQTANGVLAVLRQFDSREPVLRLELCLYLDTIQDPGNFGTIIRIADWFGIKEVVCTEGCADLSPLERRSAFFGDPRDQAAPSTGRALPTPVRLKSALLNKGTFRFRPGYGQNLPPRQISAGLPLQYALFLTTILSDKVRPGFGWRLRDCWHDSQGRRIHRDSGLPGHLEMAVSYWRQGRLRQDRSQAAVACDPTGPAPHRSRVEKNSARISSADAGSSRLASHGRSNPHSPAAAS